MTQNNWEKRYKKEWQSWFNEMEAYGSFEMMRDFISQLLKAQREEIIKEIEMAINKKYNFTGQGSEYNKGVFDGIQFCLQEIKTLK